MAGMTAFVCVHAHFYQPPRENPWLDAVEAQPTAEPYHDWNERITAECYAPNTCSRLLDAQNRIIRLVNNYARISFNVGPTLLSWLETHAPATYRAILDADKDGQQRFGGHGPALAQVYNHVIMPLACARDRRTQVLWGLADFEARFGRKPEGMWLAETAANTDTLEDLAAAGLRFTILSPYQAARVRPRAGGEWTDVRGGKVDATRPYLVSLPSGKSIAVFFYDGPVSQAIAFEKLLSSGERLAERLLAGTQPDATTPHLMHVATDGETYGHHSPFGEMALAFALDRIEEGGRAKLTVYGEFLGRCPPEHDAEIVENSSWSCAHGVDRWRADCGCRIGHQPGWTQAWRSPLRKAFDHLRDRLALLFERVGAGLFPDPWAARDGYVEVILDRRPVVLDEFLRKHAGREFGPGERVTALRLLEMQRHCLLMYTSCGWFFDDLSGIETLQVIAYAARAAELAQLLGDAGAEGDLLAHLKLATSNLPGEGDGWQVFERSIRPRRVGLDQAAAHYALAALFEPAPQRIPLYSFEVATQDARRVDGSTPGHRLYAGRCTVTCRTTQECGEFAFAAVHLGELNVYGGVRPAGSVEADGEAQRALEAAFVAPALPEVFRRLEAEYDAPRYSLGALFKDQQHELVQEMLGPVESAIESAFRDVVRAHTPTMLLVHALDTGLLPAFRTALQFVTQAECRRALRADVPDLDVLTRLADDVSLWQSNLEHATLDFAATAVVTREVGRLASPPAPAQLRRCLRLLTQLGRLKLHPNLWAAQNHFYDLVQSDHSSLPAPTRLLLAELAERLKVAM